MELRELTAFVVVVEEGGMSAAARRLHVSQPALSQTISALERELGVTLLTRRNTGVEPTEAGITLLGEARAILARRDQAVRTMTAFTAEDAGIIRIGVPLELAPDVLPGALAKFAVTAPRTRVVPRRLSTSAQFAALRDGALDIGLVRERPPGTDLDAMLVARERLGVYLDSTVAAERAGPDGVPLESLAGLSWAGFPRAGSPAWYDELTAILRSHGIDVGPPVPEDLELIAPMKFAAVAAGRSFALAPPVHGDLPAAVAWAPLVGGPLVRRTWAVWPAMSRRRDIGQLIAAFDVPSGDGVDR